AFEVLQAGRRLDRDAAGIEGHALADEGEWRLALLAAIPAHDDEPAFPRRAEADPQQRVHAELAHGLDVEHLDADTDLLQRADAARELLRIKDVARLVGEAAREAHPPAE